MQDPTDNSTVYWRVILGKYSNYYYYIIIRVEGLGLGLTFQNHIN